MKIISDSGLDRDDILLVCRGGGSMDLQEVIETSRLRLLQPARLARDLDHRKEHGCQTQKVQPVDMFPRTHHVEYVALITS